MDKQVKTRVSVIMPAYNVEKYIAEAVSSIQNQTYKDWELIIIDDYSTDATYQILQELAKKDPQVKVYRNGKHRGVSGAANFGLRFVTGKYIARMDADDISLPNRFRLQVDYLKKHPKVIGLGGQCQMIDHKGHVIGEKRFPTEWNQVRKMIFSSIPLQQPSLMVDSSRLPKDFVWYENDATTAEEVELLFKFFEYGQVINLPQTLLQYRIHTNNVSLKDPKKTFYSTLKTRLRAIKKYNFRPSVKGVLTTLAQLIIVTLLPSAWIYPIYAKIRGLKRTGQVKISLFPAYAWKKSIQH